MLKTMTILKKYRAGRLTLSEVNVCYKATVIKTIRSWCKRTPRWLAKPSANKKVWNRPSSRAFMSTVLLMSWFQASDFQNCEMWCILSHFSHVWLCVTLWTIACQAPLSMRFSRQEYWSELSCPPAGDLPNPGIEPSSLISPALADRFFTTSACNNPNKSYCV